MAGALILTAEIGCEDLAWLNGLRRAHYPPERNQVPAHLTIFHALPPSAEGEARSRLVQLASEPPPQASIAGLMDLGGGIAFRVVSPDLDRVRSDLSAHFRGLLSAQDAQGWRPHVTIQNKVAPREARALMARLQAGFRPRSLEITGLALHRYLDGPWEAIARSRFRGG